MKPTTYVGRVGPVRVTAQEGSERVAIAFPAEDVQLDAVESHALLRVLIEARRRSLRKGHP